MKPNKFALIASMIFAAGAYATGGVAYADREDQKENSKAASHERERSGKDGGELLQGVPHPVTLSNLGNKPLKEIEIRFTGKDPTDFVQSNNCGEELKQSGSCVINVTFMPRSKGTKTATMVVRTSGGTKSVYLTGTGV